MAAHNFDGSHRSNGVVDNVSFPLDAGGQQRLSQPSDGDSVLSNPGTDSSDDRAPNPVPMTPFGHEDEPDSLFDLNPSRKG